MVQAKQRMGGAPVLALVRDLALARALALALALVGLGVSGAGAQTAAGPSLKEATAAPDPAVQIAFGTGIDRATRTIEGGGAVFVADEILAGEGRIFALTHLQNLAVPSTVTHVWYHNGKTMARVRLNVGSADWRTWSSKRLMAAWTGDWELKVLDPDGMVLASSHFTIK